MEEIDKIRHNKMKDMLDNIQIIDLDEGSGETQDGPTQLTDMNFDEFIETNSVVMVDCWAEWCGPCKMLAPTIDELADEYNGRAAIAKLNVDHNPMKAREFGIQGIPTMLLFKDGKLVDRIVGAIPKPAIASKLDYLL